jgi:hypothetical protein
MDEIYNNTGVWFTIIDLNNIQFSEKFRGESPSSTTAALRELWDKSRPAFNPRP